MQIFNHGTINGSIDETTVCLPADATMPTAAAAESPTSGAAEAVCSGQHRIAKGKKTDVIKILSAMYDLHLFETADGRVAPNKQALMEEFGRLFDDDFSDYSTILAKAKATSKTFCDVFSRLRERAEQYYLH